jgi:hypothetical protein
MQTNHLFMTKTGRARCNLFFKILVISESGKSFTIIISDHLTDDFTN